jgi:1-acyl-sn-glycerol-3-phosphate acyltransferase
MRRVYFHGTTLPQRALHHRPTERQVMYVAWPHGMYGEGVSMVLLTSDAWSDVLPVCSSVLFSIPIAREFASLWGAVPANAHDMKAALRAGHSLLIFPEGMRGALGAHPRELLAKRKGYIRVAQDARPSAPLVFVTLQVHHAEPAYSVVPFARPLQLLSIKWLRYPWPVIHWGWGYSFLPRRQQYTFLLGPPISGALPEQTIHEEINKAVGGAGTGMGCSK